MSFPNSRRARVWKLRSLTPVSLLARIGRLVCVTICDQLHVVTDEKVYIELRRLMIKTIRSDCLSFLEIFDSLVFSRFEDR